jgi:hypothetical protein
MATWKGRRAGQRKYPAGHFILICPLDIGTKDGSSRIVHRQIYFHGGIPKMVNSFFSKVMTIVLAVPMILMGCLIQPANATMRLFTGQTVYVPVYSHIYSGDREQPVYLAATLSIRNTDRKHAITITAVDYYDSEGKFLKHYIEKPLALGAMATRRYVVSESDKSGGSGAKFIVAWQSDQPVVEPLIESVMISTKTQQGISFTSRGQVLETISP